MDSEEILISPYRSSDILLIKAITNLHPGSGRGGEVVDLPVQKDNLGFPIIYSSSIKGAMKSAFWQHDQDTDVIKALFGPDPEDEEKYSSAVAVLDAFVLAFPVRSLEGVYAFATCPLLLRRLSEYSELAGRRLDYVEELATKQIGRGSCLVSQKTFSILVSEAIGDRIIINEEIDAKCEKIDGGSIERLEGALDIDSGRLILLNDDDAQIAMGRSLVRVTRIRVERERKIVERGGLWTEEYIPWGTVFATSLLYSKSKKINWGAQEVRERLKGLLNKTKNYLIIGGDETVGRGIVKLKFLEESGGRQG